MKSWGRGELGSEFGVGRIRVGIGRSMVGVGRRVEVRGY